MSWLGKGLGMFLGGPIGALVGHAVVDNPNDQRDDQEKYQDQQRQLREQAKQTQLGMLNQMQGPQLTDAAQRRIKALEDESQHTSLAEDPYFQAQRAQLVQGGQQALSSTQNAHAAYGTTGGFKNQGSAADIYDRLSGQLAQLGQKSTELKDQKAQQAADIQQQFADSQLAFQNAQTKARIAIESGDSAAASQALAEAFNAKKAIDQAQMKMIGGMVGAGATAAGALVGGPAGAGIGKSMGDMFSASAAPAETQTISDLPWSAQRARQYA
jgi:hypothetical protein